MGIKPPPSLPIKLLICLVGTGGMIGQLLLLREFFILGTGNELVIGIVLSNWLLLEAVGSLGGGFLGKHVRRTWFLFVLLYVAYLLILPIALFFSRDIIIRLFQVLPGEGVGYFPLFIATCLILLIPVLLHGAHFPISAQIMKRFTPLHNPEGSAYFYETLGTLLAGILFTFVLARWDNIFTVCLVIAIFQLVILGVGGYFLTSRRSMLLFGAAALLLAGYAVPLANYLHETSLIRQWYGKVPVHYSHSYHGNIMVLEEGKEHHFYYDGRPFLSVPYPEIDAIHDFVHFTLGTHPQPEKGLIMGGAHGPFMREMLQHPWHSIIYTEIDPALIRIMDDYFPPSLYEELQDPRLERVYKDGRLYLARTDEQFDYIALGFIEPDTLQTNRYFTHDFFQLVKNRLDEDGLFAFSLPGSYQYLPPALRELNATIHATLHEVFPHVKVIPGELNIFFASEKDITLCADNIASHLEDRQVESDFIHPSHLQFRLSPSRKQWFYSMIRGYGETLNRDFLPRGFYHASQHWQQQFSPTAGRIQQRIEQVPFLAILGVLAGGGLLWLWGTSSMQKKKQAHLPVIIGTTGILGMVFDLVVIFIFQCLYGYVYHMIGLLMGVFMFGAFAGSRWSIPKSKDYNILPLLRKTEGALLISLLFIYLLAHIFSQFMEVIPPFLSIVSFIALSFCLGFLIGAQFPLATRLFRERGRHSSQTAGVLYASDLFGGWAGGLAFSLVFFPFYGLGRTLLILALIKSITFISLLLTQTRGKT